MFIHSVGINEEKISEIVYLGQEVLIGVPLLLTDINEL